MDNNLSEFVSLCQSVVDGAVPMLEEDLYRKAKENGYVNSKMEWKDFKAKWQLEKLERQESLGVHSAIERQLVFPWNKPTNES